MKYVLIDFETTGLDGFPKNKVTQIGALKVMGGKPIAKFVTYVNPEENISDEISAITGITNETVANAPKMEQVIGSLMEFIGDCKIVSYNAEFDIDKYLRPMVRHYCGGLELSNEVDCALIKARECYVGGSHKLVQMYHRLGYNEADDNLKAHDAMSDVIMAYTVYEACLKK